MPMKSHHSNAAYRGYRDAGIRLSEDAWADRRYSPRNARRAPISCILQFDKAHVVMLTESGVISTETGVDMLREIRDVISTEVELAGWDGGMHWTETKLIQSLGEDVGGWINVGRSTGDISEVARRLHTRLLVIDNIASLNRLRGVLLTLSSSFTDTVVPGQTFLQHAQPTTLAHWICMWEAMLGRDVHRYLELLQRLNESPAGAGILSTTDFRIDRSRVSDLLGFDRPIANSMDAIMSHDVALEAVSAMAISALDLSRIADDLELWMSSEYRYIDFPDRFCATSSIMPQKRNPNLPQQIKAQCARAIGAMSVAIAAERGATGQPMLERFESDAILWELLEDLPALMGDLSTMLPAMRVDSTRMKDSSERHWSSASDLASLITAESALSWRSAHQITGIAVRICYERDIHPAALTPDIVDEAARMYGSPPISLSSSAIESALDSAAAVSRRTIIGGSASGEVSRAIASAGQRLDEDIRATSAWAGRVAESETRLSHAVDRLLAN